MPLAPTVPAPPASPQAATIGEHVLDEIQRRVLWLAVRMVDAANHDRSTGDGVKVGGHQASSASMVSIMTALWFSHLSAEDRVAVKPHASPVLHAIHYLLGDLDGSYLTRLRDLGGLQAYPSRTKDPDRVDFSTGSVGLGAAAPLFAAVARRYVDAHFGERAGSRFVAVLGDAELDEGNVWEAIADPATEGLGNVLWVVDCNRQSLDRVVPGVRIRQWRGQFKAAGWHVVDAKYGRRLKRAFGQPGGEVLRAYLDGMRNEQYQSLFGLQSAALRERFLDGAPGPVIGLVNGVPDEELGPLITDLGGHDLLTLLDAFASADDAVHAPTVVFAYTVKGWGLPIAGNPRNHSALLSAGQVDALRTATGLEPADEWDRFAPLSEAGLLCARRREALQRPAAVATTALNVPRETRLRVGRPMSSQEAFGRVLVGLSRDPEVAPYLVTTAPDVATSTNLAGYINRAGVFHPQVNRNWSEDALVKWTEGPSGHHIELGISEMNLFLLLGQLGLTSDHSGQVLLPVGTVYDPFVLRGLDAFVYSAYSGSRFVVAGSPSGVSLAPEGGAHQSTITASVGLELPGVTFIEPAYACALDWLLCDALSDIGRGASARGAPTSGEGSYYFRLTTRPIDQTPFEDAKERLGAALLRRQVLAGGYRLVDALVQHRDLQRDRRSPSPLVTLVASGAVVPQALEASRDLATEGVAADVVDVTSIDRLYVAWQDCNRQGVRTARAPATPGVLRALFPTRTPLVAVHDAASHTMAWLGSALGAPMLALGVDTFGQSGSVDALYRQHSLDRDSIVNAAFAALELTVDR